MDQAARLSWLRLTCTLCCVSPDWCRMLYNNQLTGTLPEAWSALASLNVL
jgi:hypothetical protein